MALLMEDDYAPPTRYPLISMLAPFALIALIALLIWWRRSGD